MKEKDIWNYMHELWVLREKRAGQRCEYFFADRESIAEHSHRWATIAFILALMEWYENPYEACTMFTFHDTPEAVSWDKDLIQKQYVKVNIEGILEDQLWPLNKIWKEIRNLIERFEAKKDQCAKICADADKLELILSIKEQGHNWMSYHEAWVDWHWNFLQTESAKKLFEYLKDSSPRDWWNKYIPFINDWSKKY